MDSINCGACIPNNVDCGTIGYASGESIFYGSSSTCQFGSIQCSKDQYQVSFQRAICNSEQEETCDATNNGELTCLCYPSCDPGFREINNGFDCLQTSFDENCNMYGTCIDCPTHPVCANDKAICNQGNLDPLSMVVHLEVTVMVTRPAGDS